MATQPTSELDVSPQRAEQLAREGAQMIDVREDHEYEAGHVAGIRHVPLGDLTAAAETIDRDTPVVFVCRSGGRSTMAAQAFRAAGYEAFSLDGGTIAWHELGLPLEPADGHVADH
jgi:hydroxyacylglutathione hydrolase/adenylyltransferase/sulfurtransferase